jgi:hypothetical protein
MEEGLTDTWLIIIPSYRPLSTRGFPSTLLSFSLQLSLTFTFFSYFYIFVGNFNYLINLVRWGGCKLLCIVMLHLLQCESFR